MAALAAVPASDTPEGYVAAARRVHAARDLGSGQATPVQVARLGAAQWVGREGGSYVSVAPSVSYSITVRLEVPARGRAVSELTHVVERAAGR